MKKFSFFMSIKKVAANLTTLIMYVSYPLFGTFRGSVVLYVKSAIKIVQ